MSAKRVRHECETCRNVLTPLDALKTAPQFYLGKNYINLQLLVKVEVRACLNTYIVAFHPVGAVFVNLR